MAIRCPKCHALWPEGQYTGIGIVYIGTPECSTLELTCPEDGCDGSKRRFMHVDNIEEVSQHFDIELRYEATAPLVVMGEFYYMYRRENRVIFNSPDASHPD